MNKIYILLFAAGTLIFAACGAKKTETKTTTTSDSVAVTPK